MTQDVHAYPRFSLLNRDHCEAIHLASLEILRRTGVRVHHPEALTLLRQSDAVITDESLVRFPPALVEWALKQAPSRIALCKRGTSEPAIRMEGTEVAFGSGSDCNNYLNPRTGQHELFTAKTVVDCIHLVDALPEIGFCMSMGVPSDINDGISPFRHQFALMLKNTTKPIVFISGDRADCETIVAMAAAAAGGIEQLRLNPTLLGYSQATTPLQHPADSLGKLLFMAEQGLPMVHMPSPMMGGTAPVTMAGAMAVGNAEVLSGFVIAQLKRQGTPMVYSQGVHHMDMRTTISVYGAPEFELARVAMAEMARFYNLPNWGYAGYSDSIVMDEQAAADATSSVMVALLSGQHLAHDVGYLEAGLTTSPEMIAFTAEVIARERYFMQGITLDAEAFALDLIHQLGPGGQYLTEDHTLRHFRELWNPTLFSRERKDIWVRKGKKRLGDRLREKTIALIDGHQPEPLPAGIEAEIDYVLHRDRESTIWRQRA
jgi:trimethylamine--corrinoid protein Co-methyltransferase